MNGGHEPRIKSLAETCRYEPLKSSSNTLLVSTQFSIIAQVTFFAAFYGDDVYDLLSASFDDPSATIVYPYVYRILNSNPRPATDVALRQNAVSAEQGPASPVSSRPMSPQE